MNNDNQVTTSQSCKANKKSQQKAKQKRIKAEVNAQQRIVKSWERLTQSVKYRKAAMKESCERTTQILEDELFDGIFLNLSERHGKKSHSFQKRILRRIVNKRQAQSVHRLFGKSGGRFTRQMQRYYASQTLNEIRRYQLCLA